MASRVGIAITLTLLLAATSACQPGTGGPAATQAPGSTPAAVTTQPAVAPTDAGGPAPAEVFFLDGAVSYTVDTHSENAGSFTDIHKTMTVTVHLVGPGDGGPGFKDAGSTYNFQETTKSHDPKTVSQCGLDTESAGTGSGPFATPGYVLGYYSYFDGTVSLSVNAAYTNTSTLTFLCNALTKTDTTDDQEKSSCGDPAGGVLMGTVKGNTVDFACTETYVLGTGGITVKGTLTSR